MLLPIASANRVPLGVGRNPFVSNGLVPGRNQRMSSIEDGLTADHVIGVLHRCCNQRKRHKALSVGGNEPLQFVEPIQDDVDRRYSLALPRAPHHDEMLTVRGNVEFGPKVNGISKKDRKKLSEEYIEMAGLTEFADSFPGELSGGMRQRVALCRALANKPDILLCDEPFAALDAMTRQVMQQELLNIVSRSGQTVFFITHSIDEALILSDRVVVMSARPGQVKAVYDIELSRPRKIDVQLTDEYLKIKRKIWNLVEEEVKASMNM